MGFVLLTVLVLMFQFVTWWLYMALRAERNMLTQNLANMTASRDGWRSVGERALLLAQVSRRVTVRATRVARGAIETDDST